MTLLALRMLIHNRARLVVTLAGIAFAVLLVVFQSALLCGFLQASSTVIDATDADLWIVARGVPCFEFPAPIDERYRSIARGVSGVQSVYRVASGMAVFEKPNGTTQTIVVVGADDGVGTTFPQATLRNHHPEHVVIDASDRSKLGVEMLPTQVEIASLRASVSATTRGFGSFIGSPYVFTKYSDAVRYTGLDRSRTTYLLVQVSNDRSVGQVQRTLAARLSDVDVLTTAEFSRRSRQYWVLQTGAGGAILTAAMLGFIVGVLTLSQTMSAMTLENVGEFATLKAMGASGWFVRSTVLLQALVCGSVGGVLGLLLSLLAIHAARGGVPWIELPAAALGVVMVACVAMAALASIAAVRKVATIEPGSVFHA